MWAIKCGYGVQKLMHGRMTISRYAHVIRFVSFVLTTGGGRSSRVVSRRFREEKCDLCNRTIVLQSFGQIAPAYMKRVLQNKVHGCMTKALPLQRDYSSMSFNPSKVLPPKIVSHSPCPFGTKRTGVHTTSVK